MRKDVAVVPPASLDVRIELLSSRPPAGTVVLTNRTSADLHLWRRGSLWGDETLSFEVTEDGRTERITLKPQDYTVNVPLSDTVAPGGRYDIRFNLADGSWEPEAIIKGLGAGRARLTAVYDVAATPEAPVHHVWIGRIRSEPVPL